MDCAYKIVDCHMHIVPDFDDGSANLKMSMEMLRSAYTQGVSTVFCTSHSYVFDNLGIDYYNAAFEELQNEVNRSGLKISLFTGEELYCYHSIDRILRKLDKGEYHTYGNTKYALLEFDPHDTEKYATYSVKRMIDGGYIPIIAHVERYYRFANCDIVEEWKQMGAHIQINAFSLDNETNFFVKLFAREMLARKQIDVIGSDAHRTTHRPPVYTEGVKYIIDHCGPEYAKAVINGNAQKYFNLQLD